MQIKSGLKKEFLFFSRSFRMWGVIIAILAFAITDPLMMRGLLMLGEMVDDMSSTNVTVNDEVLDGAEMNDAQVVSALETSLGGSLSAGVGLSMALSDMLATSLLITMLVLMGTAGNEQKKRSIIIPNTAGLTPNNYIVPKFVIYPLFSFALIFIGTIVSAWVSTLAFGGSIELGNILLAGLCGGVYFSFMIIIQMMVGISTAKPGITVVLIYIASSIIPLILSAFRVDKFNPFSLKTMAMTAASYGDTSFLSSGDFSTVDLLVSIGVTLAISIVLYLMTLLILNAKKIDNSGNEAVL